MPDQREEPAARSTPARCGVVGGGRMGAGIVHALLLAGANVVLVEREEETAAARDRVARAVRGSVTRGQVPDAAPLLARLAATADAAALADAELVVEAVPEDVRLGVARYLEKELGPRFTPPQLMIDMVERGDLGRKAGRGFYDWSEEA